MDCLILDGDLKTQKSEQTYCSIRMYGLEAHSSTTHLHPDNAMHTESTSGTSKVLALDAGLSPAADISSFLSRKVKIFDHVWPVGTELHESVDCWQAFFENDAVKKKMDNYYLVKGNLMLTIYINGTPFHSGMILGSYQYLQSGSVKYVAGQIWHIVTKSQRPHIWINASTCKSGCICVPYYAPAQFQALVSPAMGNAKIGRLDLDSVRNLEQINGGTDSITVSVFAELQDAVLSAPTSQAVAFSGPCDDDFSMFSLEAHSDEYNDTGVVSGPASTVASIAGMLSSAPVIGPLAVATQLAARSIGAFARFFGFSKPVQTADIIFVKNTPVGNLALTEGLDSSAKLTVTAKQELCISPDTVGLPNIDELSLEYLCKKESFYSYFPWNTSMVMGEFAYAFPVTPAMEHRFAITGGHEIVPTSLSYVSRMFEAWSGSLTYRFQVIASQYHRGRIAVIFDPWGDLASIDPFNTTFNTIIDLSEGRDFTLTVNWQNEHGCLLFDNDNSEQFSTVLSAATKNIKRPFENGILLFKVVNELVVPDGSSGVEIMVSIKAGDDFKLYNPSSRNMARTTFFPPIAASGSDGMSFSMFDLEAHSAVEITPDGENAPEGEINKITITQDAMAIQNTQPLIYYGETITSLRQLLKRYCYVRSLTVEEETAGVYDTNMTRYTMNLKAMPLPTGPDPDGVDLTAALSPYTYGGMTNIEYIKNAFSGWRGGIRWKFLPTTSSVVSMAVARREDDTARASSYTYNHNSKKVHLAGDGHTKYAHDSVLLMVDSGSGMAVTQNRSMDSLEVEIPYALPLRFSKTYGKYGTGSFNTLPFSYPGGSAFTLIGNTDEGKPANFSADAYVAGAEDLTFFGFVGAPNFYIQTLIPLA